MNLIKEEAFKSVHNSKPTRLVTLKNSNGLVSQISTYGAIVVSLFVPDRNGNMKDIVLGYDNINDYITGNGPYMGAVCGRIANRIGKGQFTLNNKTYKLAVNNGPNHLHGGKTGFNKMNWTIVKSTPNSVELEYVSRTGEEGYPGNLTVKVTYTLTDENELRIDYLATTDETTIVNLTNHSYYNMAGEGSGSVYDQELMINGAFFTPTDDGNVPTGEIKSVKGTPMDFTAAKKIGKDIEKTDEQLKFGNGYDHNWVLNHRAGELGLAAVACDPASGRVMEIYTTQPGVQFYSANWMDGEKGKHGHVYNKREAFCLETQHFADAINIPHFPSVILQPGQEYRHSCVQKFKTI